MIDEDDTNIEEKRERGIKEWWVYGKKVETVMGKRWFMIEKRLQPMQR